MIGIFGGTFDPIHYGHLRTALEVVEQAGLTQLRFIPCGQPPHRAMPVASSEDRLAMLQLAIADEADFTLDQRELERDGPSYMVDTLTSLREELGEAQPLGLILGMDAFSALDSWHEWQRLTELAHLLVMTRPGWEQSGVNRPAIQQLIAAHDTSDISLCQQKAAGSLVFLPVSQLGISSTLIRQTWQEGGSCRYLLPDSVLSYIEEKQLY